MRRALVIAAGTLIGLTGFGVAFTVAGSGDDPPRTKVHEVQPAANECVHVLNYEALAQSEGSKTAEDVLRRLFPEETDVSRKDTAPDVVVFEKRVNGKKVAAYEVRRTGRGWIMSNAEVVDTNCPDQPGYRPEQGPGQNH